MPLLHSSARAERLMTPEESKRFDRRLERESQRSMDELEKLLEIYLIEMLALTHKELVKGIIELPEYYKDTQVLQSCINRFNEAREL